MHGPMHLTPVTFMDAVRRTSAEVLEHVYHPDELGPEAVRRMDEATALLDLRAVIAQVGPRPPGRFTGTYSDTVVPSEGARMDVRR
jgi:hypothetical protein